jgi:RNA polymerase sigma-70 factor, ECF subfamily
VTDWEIIVEQYGGLVWATVCRLLGNCEDASDCFQETFLEAVKISRKEPVRDWTALLRHLATVRAIDFLRVRCRQRSHVAPVSNPEVMISREASPVQEAEASELAERLRVALANLSQDQASVFCLSCLDKLSYQEIGERLDMTANSVGVLLHRARQRLRELLAPVDLGEIGDD